MAEEKFREAHDVPKQFVTISGGNDSTTYDPPLRRIYVGTGGTVVFTALDGNNAQADFSYTNVANGSYLTGRFIKIKATSTTASGILGEY
jgi:predicted PP-loop superfamily ATPase